MDHSKKVSKYRSEVIEKFINIEVIVNTIISQHYFKRGVASFIFELLCDVNCTFALKRNVLYKIAPSFSKIEDLNRLNSIRNYFAHCNMEVFEGSTRPLPGVKGKILNPKDIKKGIDFDVLYREFVNKEESLTQALWDLYLSLGGEWVGDT
jgi:hypothetical protein